MLVLSSKASDSRDHVNYTRGLELVQPEESNHYFFIILYIISNAWIELNQFRQGKFCFIPVGTDVIKLKLNLWLTALKGATPVN